MLEMFGRVIFHGFAYCKNFPWGTLTEAFDTRVWLTRQGAMSQDESSSPQIAPHATMSSAVLVWQLVENGICFIYVIRIRLGSPAAKQKSMYGCRDIGTTVLKRKQRKRNRREISGSSLSMTQSSGNSTSATSELWPSYYSKVHECLSHPVNSRVTDAHRRTTGLEWAIGEEVYERAGMYYLYICTHFVYICMIYILYIQHICSG